VNVKQMASDSAGKHKPGVARGRPRYDLEDRELAGVFREIADCLKLDRGGKSPLWVQLRNALEQSIDRGLLADQSRLPSEQAMCEYFNVSRPVVRAAITALSNQGLIVKFPRKGMFVSAPDNTIDFMTTNLGVFGDLTEKGHEVTVKTLDLRRVAADDNERQVFGLSDNFEVVRIKRLYYKNGLPITLTRISFPAHRVPGLEKLELDNRSVFETIKTKYGLAVTQADRWLRAKLPTAEEAKFLQVDSSTPLIGIRSLAREPLGAPLEYYESTYNPAHGEIHIVAGRKV